MTLSRVQRYLVCMMNPLLRASAFVVQFNPETDIDADRIKGRIEHVDSGRLAHFDCLQDLLDVVKRLLREARADQYGDKGVHTIH